MYGPILSQSGLLKGDYNMVDGEALATEANYAKNPVFGLHADRLRWPDMDWATAASRAINLKSGAQVPVEVVAELDRKTDDGKPYTGAVQFSTYAANGAPSPEEGAEDACTTALDVAAEWNLRGSTTNCGVATLL